MLEAGNGTAMLFRGDYNTFKSQVLDHIIELLFQRHKGIQY